MALTPDALLLTCKQARYQGSGPGGQKRNRVYSGIRLTHVESGLSVEADARRESRRNLEDALHRLRLELALAMVAKPSAQATVGTENAGSDAGGPEGFDNEDVEKSPAFQVPPFRANASPSHVDFPVMALRALYFFVQNRGQASAAAQSLGCTASALARFFKSDKALWTKAREIREAHGLHPLK